MAQSLPRRMALGLIAFGATVTGIARTAGALVPTPPQTTGPFYPPPADRFADDDWDLEAGFDFVT